MVPLDPLDDVPKPKGFPDGPPPRPRDDIFGVGKRFFISRNYLKISNNNTVGQKILKSPVKKLVKSNKSKKYFFVKLHFWQF